MHPETTDLEGKKIGVSLLLFRVPPSGGWRKRQGPAERGTPNKPEGGTPNNRRRARGLAMIIAALICLPIWNHVGECGDSDFVFNGTIQALPGASGFIGEWNVSGRKVRVFPFTLIIREGAVQVTVGASVRVEGFLQTNGSVIAKKIQVKQASGGSNVKLAGKVEELPATTGRVGNWKVAGTTVRVSATTMIKQEKAPVSAGSGVKVDGARRADGSIDAHKIEAELDVDDGGDFQLMGAIECLPNAPGRIGEWSVGGRKVNVTSATKISPNANAVAVGYIADVQGLRRQDDSIDAREIEVRPNSGGGSTVEFEGDVETLPGTAGQIGVWTVSGRRVNVTATTRIELEGGPVAVGANAEIRGAQQPDGSINAMKIQVENVADPARLFGK